VSIVSPLAEDAPRGFRSLARDSRLAIGDLPHGACGYLPNPSSSARRLELRLLDPQVARELGIIAADLLDAALGFLAAMNVSTASPSGKSGERASSTTA
jgi:hypothetical protein